MNCSNARKPDKINLWRLWSNDPKFAITKYHIIRAPLRQAHSWRLLSSTLSQPLYSRATTSPPPILHGVEASSASHRRVCFHSIELRLGDHPSSPNLSGRCSYCFCNKPHHPCQGQYKNKRVDEVASPKGSFRRFQELRRQVQLDRLVVVRRTFASCLGVELVRQRFPRAPHTWRHRLSSGLHRDLHRPLRVRMEASSCQS